MILPAIIAILSFLFFASLIILSVFGKIIPCDQRYLVIIFLSISLGYSAPAIVGYLSINGRLNIPWVRNNPLQFKAASGFALLLLIFFVGNYAYVERAKCETTPPEDVLTLYLHEAKDVERNWLETYSNSHVCNQLSSKAKILVQKLEIINVESLSPRRQIGYHFYLARLYLIQSTLDIPSPLPAIESTKRHLHAAQSLGDQLKLNPTKNKADFDWYMENEYEGIILSNEVILDLRRYALSSDTTHLKSAAQNYQRLLIEYNDLVMAATPLEKIFWDAARFPNGNKIKAICST